VGTVTDLRQRFLNRLARTLIGDTAVLGERPAPLNPEALRAIKARYPRPKFFIIGHARSGTTLLARLTRLHPGVHCNWQGHFFSRRGPLPFLTAADFADWFSAPNNRWTEEGENVSILARLVCDFLMEREADEEGAELVGDKTPNEDGASSVDWMHSIYPDAAVLYIVRDGRDVLVSKRVQAFIDHPEYLRRADLEIRKDLRREGEEYLSSGRSIFTRAALKELATGWAHDVQASHQRGRELFGERYRALRYEDILADPEGEMKAVWSHLGASEPSAEILDRIDEEMTRNPASDWHDRAAPDLVRSLPRGVAGGWRRVLNRRDQEAVEAIAWDTLVEWGYVAKGG
jgi:hypothetical protein